MKKTELQNDYFPETLLLPFCYSGTKNTLPVVNNDSGNPQLADLTNGFPVKTQGSPDDGKLPPERADFNALGYLATSYDFYYQAGGTFTYNSTVATAIGGYPKDAKLWYTNTAGRSMILRSTKDDNEDDFTQDESYIGTSWVIESFIGVQNDNVDLLDFKFSDKLLNNMSWVLSDGSWLSGSTYTNVYTHLLDDIGFKVFDDSDVVTIGVSCGGFTSGNYLRDSASDIVDNGTTYYAWSYLTDTIYITLDVDGMSTADAVSAMQGQRIYTYDSSVIQTIHKIRVETTDSYVVGGNTISLNVLVGSDGHRIVNVSSGGTEYESVDALFNDLGVAWYYVLDTFNTRFKLPRTKYGVNGYRSKVGKYVEAGVPNITGKFLSTDRGYGGASGAFEIDSRWSTNYASGGGDNWGVVYDFNASRSSSVYGDSSTVQPPATEMYLYFYVGGFNDTAIAQTAGINASTINAKAENDLSNITNGGKFLISSNSAVDYSSMISVAVGVSSVSYTAPANGVVIATTSGGTNDATGTITVNGVQIPSSAQTNSGAYFVSFTIPLAKNDVLVMSSIHGYSNIAWVVFIPCFGG